MKDVEMYVADLAKRAERIERDKNGKALTEDEVRTLKANTFLQQIAPYLYPSKTHVD